MDSVNTDPILLVEEVELDKHEIVGKRKHDRVPWSSLEASECWPH